MKIKTLLLPALLCGTLIALTPALRAQDSGATTSGSSSTAAGGGKGGGRGFSVDDQLARLTKALTLTDDQQAKIKPILEDEHKKIQALFQDQSVQKADKQSKMKDIRDAANTAIKAILTPDQSTKYDQLLQERQNRRNGGGGNNQ
jgi:Spy/CpxP family protein refolding chaperone